MDKKEAIENKKQMPEKRQERNRIGIRDLTRTG